MSIPEYTLTRFSYKSGHGTFGRFLQWATLEDDWLNNRSNVSCIPTGRYLCVRRMYNRGGYETFHITEVPDRSLILIHGGNTEEHVKGCVALGLSFGTMEVNDEDGGGMMWKIATRSSMAAHREFMAQFKGVDQFWLTIEDHPHTSK